ncbi:MAG: radical SAM protein, partial [Pedobacter sp.]
HENICRYIHLPVQSGNTRILSQMNRTYTREWYLSKVKRIREIMPDCGISTDVISGFCGETEEVTRETYRCAAGRMSVRYCEKTRSNSRAAHQHLV